VNSDRLPALLNHRAAVAYRPAREQNDHATELIVIGQFALRQKLVPPPHPQPSQQRLPLHVVPAYDEPVIAAPVSAPLGGGPGLLPTEAYLALRTATASHRRTAYAAFC